MNKKLNPPRHFERTSNVTFAPSTWRMRLALFLFYSLLHTVGIRKLRFDCQKMSLDFEIWHLFKPTHISIASLCSTA